MPFAKLYHRKNSKRQIIYGVRYYLTGQSSKNESRFTIGNVSPRRAKEIFERIRALVVQGIDPHDFFQGQTEKNYETQRIRLSELEEAYLKYCAIMNRPTTLELKGEAYRNLRNFIGDLYIDKIAPEKIEAWMASLQTSKTTINIKLRTIRAMFNWGVKRGLINTSPFAGSGIQQFRVPDSDPEDYFSLKEVKLILQTLKESDEALWRLVFLALETGGRLSELTALTGNDVNLKNASVLFRGSTTKTGQRRYVPLRSVAVKELKRWRVMKDKKLFHWRHPSNASKRFRQLLRELNLRETNLGARSFHTLRHTYASHLLMAGVNIFVVSRWLGHSSVRVTEKHYGHMIPETVEVELPWGD